jgi:hypothetical protein
MMTNLIQTKMPRFDDFVNKIISTKASAKHRRSTNTTLPKLLAGKVRIIWRRKIKFQPDCVLDAQKNA